MSVGSCHSKCINGKMHAFLSPDSANIAACDAWHPHPLSDGSHTLSKPLLQYCVICCCSILLTTSSLAYWAIHSSSRRPWLCNLQRVHQTIREVARKFASFQFLNSAQKRPTMPHLQGGLLGCWNKTRLIFASVIGR